MTGGSWEPPSSPSLNTFILTSLGPSPQSDGVGPAGGESVSSRWCWWGLSLAGCEVEWSDDDTSPARARPGR